MITVEEYKAIEAEGKDVMLYGASDRSVSSIWASKSNIYDLTVLYGMINGKQPGRDDFESNICIIGNDWMEDGDCVKFRTIKLENIFLTEREAIERHVCLKLSRRKW